MTALIGEYPNKPLADYTEADRKAAREYEQGKAHWAQGRYDLLGTSKHYDEGWETADYNADLDYYDECRGIK